MVIGLGVLWVGVATWDGAPSRALAMVVAFAWVCWLE